LVSFDGEDGAKIGKERILMVNKTDGHFILDKRVDVKSADDYTGKGPGGELGGGGHPNQSFGGNMPGMSGN